MRIKNFCGILDKAVFSVVIFFIFNNSLLAAKPLDASHLTLAALHENFLIQSHATKNTNKKIIKQELDEHVTSTDFNGTKHSKYKQLYMGYPVWNGDVLVHRFHSNTISLNGTLYQDLDADLANTPAYIFTSAQADKALQHAIQLYQKKTNNKKEIAETKSDLIVYIDKNNQAHWAFLISFRDDEIHKIPDRPTYILDAITFVKYKQLSRIKKLDNVLGGGFGGYEKVGKFIYDGLLGNRPKLNMQRDAVSRICYLKNNDITVLDMRNNNAIAQFKCDQPNLQHDNIYWNDEVDATNGAYSASNDALYLGKIVKDMYQNWYNLPVLEKDGKPMMLVMRVHNADLPEVAYWDDDDQAMTFGEGGENFYTMLSLSVTAHEISHGFTAQHSHLQSTPTDDGFQTDQSGGLDESFSNMAAQAAEFYATGKNDWKIIADVAKSDENKFILYMDDPIKDCYGKTPGSLCSIDNVNSYYDGLDVHFSSGVFDKVFYLIATTKGWDPKKAFNVMVQANRFYWTPNTSFKEAACGIISATKDYKYDINAVISALQSVGFTTSGDPKFAYDIKSCE